MAAEEADVDIEGDPGAAVPPPRGPQKSGKLTIRSPTKPASHSVKWTVGEKELFEQGLAKFGRRWTKIAKLIGSRNVLQVRSYARQYLKKKTKLDGLGKGVPKLKSSSHLQPPDASLGPQGHADSNLNAVKIEALSDDEEVDITDESDEFFHIPLRNPRSVLLFDVSSNTDHETHPQGFIPPVGQDHAVSAAPRKDLHSASQGQREALFASGVASQLEKSSCNGGRCDQVDNDQTSNPSGGVEGSTSLGDSEQGAGPRLGRGPKDILDCEMLFYPSCQVDEESPEEGEPFKVPEQEVEVNRDTIQEEEKQAIPEFFEGRQAKTPERYLKIRNYILDQWEKCKPKYLNKTSVRPGLKNCGDVNCIGRIHTYLELIGAINFGCEQAVYNRPQAVYNRPQAAEKTRIRDGRDAAEAYQLAQRLQPMRARRRRVRDPWGNWCDARDLEGQTFEHLSAEELARRREEEKNKPTKAPRAPRLPKSSFDPFQLIPCSLFSEANQEPFQVQVASEALLMMDLHAHVSMAEVIGLLGGRYLEAEKVIEVCAAEPCNSLSTGLQCEMDPVSQTQASETLADRGYSVIGWYHSHPAFDPNPSLRDIDTQAKYQSYFSRGGAVFIGMIISPYNRNNPLPYSQITCLVISDEISSNGSYRVPYKFEVQQMLGEPRWELVFEKTRWMIEKYRLSPSGVPMDKIFHRESDLTCLQKLLACLKKTLGKVSNCHVAEEFLIQIEKLFLSRYRSKPAKGTAGEGCPVCPPQLLL
ncbi:deubiquitinase MYSM1 isoform X2 [Phascolarctos cinereus]|uniref:Deubiquitinase MYSM1 n=1 Tax=Phascolarctos cinereus TaxID=38626 RepID=A0A6P5KZ88_PHACI|nr:histone H2A deubiquitinase MYSM1 isoform X2 [Phascolarctos cinereus]